MTLFVGGVLEFIMLLELGVMLEEFVESPLLFESFLLQPVNSMVARAAMVERDSMVFIGSLKLSVERVCRHGV
jgi:hypothetical protein